MKRPAVLCGDTIMSFGSAVHVYMPSRLGRYTPLTHTHDRLLANPCTSAMTARRRSSACLMETQQDLGQSVARPGHFRGTLPETCSDRSHWVGTLCIVSVSVNQGQGCRWAKSHLFLLQDGQGCMFIHPSSQSGCPWLFEVEEDARVNQEGGVPGVGRVGVSKRSPGL